MPLKRQFPILNHLSRSAIASLRSKGNEIANEIETVSKEIYTGFRSKCSAVIQDFKSLLSTKSLTVPQPGSSSSTFTSRVESLLHGCNCRCAALFDRAKSALEDILKDAFGQSSEMLEKKLVQSQRIQRVLWSLA